VSFRDLREYLAELEQLGELARIRKQVDPQYEVGAICMAAHDQTLDLRLAIAGPERALSPNSDFVQLGNSVPDFVEVPRSRFDRAPRKQ
jgi:hypothetical protein